MDEQYVVVVDGRTLSDSAVGRTRALSVVLRLVDEMKHGEVAVADARTLEVFACWRRFGMGWAVRSIDGWLS